MNRDDHDLHLVDTLDTLLLLIETAKDGEFGFRTAAEVVQRTDIQQDFLQRSRECRTAAAELHALVGRVCGIPASGSSTIGAGHRGWVPQKGQLAHYSHPALLAETARGEDIAMAVYRKALADDLPDPLRNLVEQQFEGLQRHQRQVSAFRQQALAPSA